MTYGFNLVISITSFTVFLVGWSLKCVWLGQRLTGDDWGFTAGPTPIYECRVRSSVKAQSEMLKGAGQWTDAAGDVSMQSHII